jgi:hypothetical protein
LRDELLRTACSRALAKKVLICLKAVIKDARRRGNVAQNVADGVTITPGLGPSRAVFHLMRPAR